MGIAFDCRDPDRGGAGASIGFSLSDARGVSSVSARGETGLEFVCRLSCDCVCGSHFTNCSVGGSWLGDTFGDGSGEAYLELGLSNGLSSDDLFDLDGVRGCSSSGRRLL